MPRGNASTRARPSPAIQSVAQRRRQARQGHLPCLQQLAERREALFQVGEEGLPQCRHDRRTARRRLVEGPGETCRRALPSVGCGKVLQRIAAGSDRLQDVGRARRRQDCRRRQGRTEQQREIADDRELLLLIAGNEARRGDDLRDFGKPGQPVGDRRGRAQRRREDLGRIRRGHRVLHQVASGSNRFAFRVFQIQRVGIESDPGQQRGASGRQKCRRANHPSAPLQQKPVERGGAAKSDRLGLAARPQHGQQRREQQEIERDRDDHA